MKGKFQGLLLAAWLTNYEYLWIFKKKLFLTMAARFDGAVYKDSLLSCWRPGFSNIFRSFPMSDDKASVCLLFEAFCLLWVIKGEINDIWLNMLHTINQSKVLKMTYMLKQITQLCM